MRAVARRPIVIGGGIAGPVVALFLHRAGFSPEIFEATSASGTVGGGLGLAANGMNVLAAAGVEEQTRNASVTADNWCFENQAGKRLATSPGGDPERYGQAGVMITRAALHKVLMDRAVLAGIPVHRGKTFVSLRDLPGEPVSVSFADGTSAEGDFVIGADGIRSKVRQAILPHAPKPEYTGLMAPGGLSPCIDSGVTARSKQDIHFIFGQNGFFGYFNAITAEGPRTLWWSTAAAELPDRNESAATTEALHERLMKLHGDWAAPVPQLIQSATETLNIAIHDVPSLPAWSAGRAVLIGDAAHAVAPHSGQGASMALEDAQFLAKLLNDAPTAELASVFRLFELERRPRTDRVIALGRRNGQRKERMTSLAYWIQQQMIRVFVPLTRSKRQDWLLAYKVGG